MFVTPDVTLRYVNDAGIGMAFNFFGPFVCLDCDEQIANQVHAVKQSGIHGEIFTGMSLDGRHIRLVGLVRPDVELAAAMRVLHNAFNPTLAGCCTMKTRGMP